MATPTFNDSRIDRSMGMLLLIILVCGFFLIAVLGMQSVQEQAQEMSAAPVLEPALPPTYDFVSSTGRQ